MASEEPDVYYSSFDLFNNPRALQKVAQEVDRRWKQQLERLGAKFPHNGLKSFAMDKCGRWCAFDSKDLLVRSQEWHPKVFTIHCFAFPENLGVHISHVADAGRTWLDSVLVVSKGALSTQPADWWKHRSLGELEVTHAHL